MKNIRKTFEKKHKLLGNGNMHKCYALPAQGSSHKSNTMVEIKRMTRESQDRQVSASAVNCNGRSRFSASLCQINWQKLVSANFFYQNTTLLDCWSYIASFQQTLCQDSVLLQPACGRCVQKPHAAQPDLLLLLLLCDLSSPLRVTMLMVPGLAALSIIWITQNLQQLIILEVDGK